MTCFPELNLTSQAFRSRDVKKILDNFDPWRDVDPNGFIPLIFKKLSDILDLTLTHLLRILFSSGCFPDE